MALIGGSLAISKDLITLDASDHHSDDQGNGPKDNGNDEATAKEPVKK